MSRRSTASIPGSATRAARSGTAASTTTGAARHIEGGDIMPIGDGVVLVGQGERSTARATSILAQNMFEAGAARLVIGAQMPRNGRRCTSTPCSRFCDRDAATLYEPVVSQILPILFTPRRQRRRQARLSERTFVDEVSRRARHHRPRRSSPRAATSSRPSAISGTTATTSWPSRPAWSSPTSATRRRTPCSAQGRVEVHHDRRLGARPRPRRRPLHDLPDLPGLRERSTSMATTDQPTLRGRHFLTLADFTADEIPTCSTSQPSSRRPSARAASSAARRQERSP